jgi:hypothetical protein
MMVYLFLIFFLLADTPLQVLNDLFCSCSVSDLHDLLCTLLKMTLFVRYMLDSIYSKMPALRQSMYLTTN